MDSAKWDRMVARGMLTKGEVAKLQLQGSPGVILYIWAIKILRHNHGPCGGGFRELSNVKSGGRGGENNSEGIEAPGTAPAESERLLKEINMWASGLLPLQLNMEACIGGTRGLAAKQIAYTLCQFPSIYYQAVHVSVNVCALLALKILSYSSPHRVFLFGSLVVNGAADVSIVRYYRNGPQLCESNGRILLKFCRISPSE